MNSSFIEIFEIIKKSKNIVITGHVSPDGDAIGSGLALLLALKKIYKEKNIKFILEDEVPKNLKFLENSNLIIKLEDYVVEDEFDLMIAVDSGSYHRIGEVKKLNTEKTTLINIDHHISNDYFGDYNYVGDLSSTSEIIFDFLKEVSLDIDFSIAQPLYTGIVNDTGNFKHSNTTKKVLEIAAELVGYGVQPNEIIKNFFETKSMGKLKLTGSTLLNFKFVDELNLVYYYISEEELKKLGATKEETGGLVELLLSFEKSSVALLLKEDNGFIKGSFRSKYDVDVNTLASYFGGGGHIKAAGFKTDKTYEEIIDTVIKNMR